MTSAQSIARRSPPPPPNPELAARIRARRVAAGLTQLQVAARCGLAIATIARAEQAGLLSRRTATRLAGALGCGAEELRP